MKVPAGLRWSRGVVLIGIAVVLCAAVLYSRAIRRIALGEQFQYIPRESELIIAVGDLTSLWGGAQKFFRTALRSGGPFDGIGKSLREAEPPIQQLKDLEAYGLDVNRGILASVYRPTAAQGHPQFVAVLPILRRETVLNKLLPLIDDGEPTTSTIRDERRGTNHTLYHFQKLFIAFPEPHLAVISSSQLLMQRSLTLRAENLAHAANNDALYHAVRHVARGPLLVGANVFVYWQSRTAPFDERAGMLRLSPGEIRFDGEIELSGGTLRVLDALRRPSQDSTDWIDVLPEQTLGLAVLQDQELSRYRNFFAEEVLEFRAPWAEAMERWAPEAKSPQLKRIAVAVTDIEDGIPDLIVGLWGEGKELEAILPALQREYRRSRDLALLNGALAKYRRDRKTAPAPSVVDLERLRLLDPEEDSLFHRYPAGPEKFGDPRYQDVDFSNPTYERNFRGHRIRFLAPPMGPNDIAYRPDLAAADPKSLGNDRYRMATAIDRDVLWIATDVRDLETVLSGESARPGSQDRGSALDPGPKGAKVRVSLDLERLVELSLLFPGSDLEKFVREELSEMQDLSAFELNAVPSLDQSRLRFSATLRGRPAP